MVQNASEIRISSSGSSPATGGYGTFPSKTKRQSYRHTLPKTLHVLWTAIRIPPTASMVIQSTSLDPTPTLLGRISPSLSASYTSTPLEEDPAQNNEIDGLLPNLDTMIDRSPAAPLEVPVPRARHNLAVELDKDEMESDGLL